jgi:citrate synthase
MYMKLAQLIGAEVSAQMGKPLPLNVDGAIGALLCELDFPVEVSNFFFILPRVAGMAAHYHEEITREKPMRNIISAEAEYDGPAPREMEKK